MYQVLLVNMPFGGVNRPSLGLSLLKAALVRDRIACDIAYCNLLYAKRIGQSGYKQIEDFNSNALLGEWIFAADLFDHEGQDAQDASRYCAEILHPQLSAFQGANDTTHTDNSSFAPDLASDLLRMQSDASAFLESCIEAYDWSKYDLIGFTSTFQQNTASLALARRLKCRYPQLVIAFGGANCEGTMGIAIHRVFPFVDFVCSGEGDRSFPQLVAALAAYQEPPPINGIIRRVDGQSMLPASMTNPIFDLDSVPAPDFDDFFDQQLRVFGTTSDIVLPVESSRGCWWGQKAHCTFCGLNGSTMTFRSKTPSHFLRELAELVERYGIRDLAAVDNIIDMRYFESLLPLLAKSSLDINLMYETKANLREEHVKLLAESGVKHIQPGIESLSSAVLNLMRKGVRTYQNVRLLRWCAEYLISPSWNLIAGFPFENPEDYTEQVKIVPCLTHLAPPTGVTPLRLDRFSPLFVHGEVLGVRRIRPTQAYCHVYPLATKDISEIAYFFDFDYPDKQEPVKYVSELLRVVEQWKLRKDFGRLIALDNGASIFIADARQTGQHCEYELSGWRRLLYCACNDGRTLQEIKGIMAGHGCAEVSVAEIVDCLAWLIEACLVLYVDGRYLSLAIRGDYQFQLLGRDLAAGKDIHGELHSAAGRLFELHRDRFAEHLAQRMRDSCA